MRAPLEPSFGENCRGKMRGGESWLPLSSPAHFSYWGEITGLVWEANEDLPPKAMKGKGKVLSHYNSKQYRSLGRGGE